MERRSTAEETIALLEATLEASQDAILVAGLDRTIIRYNSNYLRTFGLTPETVAGGVDAISAALLPQIANAEEMNERSRVMWADPAFEGVDMVRFRDGRIYERFVAPFRIDGTIEGRIAWFRDITQITRTEEALRQSQKMEAIGRLAGGIAHDLNNALTAIAGYAELALGEIPAGHVARADVEEIRRGAERAASVTRQLLAFSRKDLMEPRLFNLNDTVSAIGRLVNRLLGADIQVRTVLAPSLPPILGDPGQIEQAIVNLAVNARDAMPGGGTLTLTTAVVEMDEAAARMHAPMAAGTWIVLAVTDTGHGMNAQTKARIFEPFFTTKDPGKGTGLGLSMVYSTLKQIGGFTFVDSEPGRGTTFRLYFKPARQSARQDTPAAARANLSVSPSDITLLVVEDEDVVRNLVASSLRMDGYRLLLAASAEEALQIDASHAGSIDLLLTDAIMPGKSGIELANLMAARRPDMRIIIMSGYTAETLAGLNDQVELLQKPFAPRDLRQRVKNALDQRSPTSR